MKKSSNPLVIVLVLVALLAGGVIAWLTQPQTDPVPSNTTRVELVTHEGEPADLVSNSSEAELAQSTVLSYNQRRWGEERGRELLGAPAMTNDARPLYHSKTVFVSMDRDGNPVVTRPSWSPLEPGQMNRLDSKPIDREDIGSYAGPQVNINDPAVQAHLAEARARSEKARYLTKWANEQIEKGNVGEDGKPQMPEDLDSLIEKLKAADAKSNSGGAAQPGKKKSSGVSGAGNNPPGGNKPKRQGS